MSGPTDLVWRLIELAIGLVIAALLVRWSYDLLRPYFWLLALVGVAIALRRVHHWRSERW